LQDATKLEFYSQKLDASLFAFGNHSKKRQETIFSISSTEMITVRVQSCLFRNANPDPAALKSVKKR
jgi:hypothetical protein